MSVKYKYSLWDQIETRTEQVRKEKKNAFDIIMCTQSAGGTFELSERGGQLDVKTKTKTKNT